MIKEIIVITDAYGEDSLSIDEVCQSCHTSEQVIKELINYGILSFRQGDTSAWKFSIYELRKIKSALRLQKDLEVNFAGIALVLELIEERNKLISEMELIHKHLFRL